VELIKEADEMKGTELVDDSWLLMTKLLSCEVWTEDSEKLDAKDDECWPGSVLMNNPVELGKEDETDKT